LEGYTVTDSISRISNLSSATSGGAGSAKDKRSARRVCHEDENDTVTISAEARRRSAAKNDEWESDEKG
jgi:hypothetical protein